MPLAAVQPPATTGNIAMKSVTEIPRYAQRMIHSNFGDPVTFHLSSYFIRNTTTTATTQTTGISVYSAAKQTPLTKAAWSRSIIPMQNK